MIKKAILWFLKSCLFRLYILLKTQMPAMIKSNAVDGVMGFKPSTKHFRKVMSNCQPMNTEIPPRMTKSPSMATAYLVEESFIYSE